MKNKVLINGRLADSGKARVSVFDRGFMYGDGVFETMRCYAGTVFKCDEHIDRLYTSLRVLGIKPPRPKAELKDDIYRTLRANILKNAYVKVIVTRGQGRFGIGYKDSFRPNAVIIAKEFEGYPEWMHGKGLSVEVAGITQNEGSVLSRVKSLNFLPYIIARFEAKDMGFDEAILVNTKGHLAEAATSNVFLVRRGRLITPSLLDGILPGIARATVLSIAKRLRIPVSERSVRPEEIAGADEAFLTNSLAEVLPVTSIGRKRIGSGSPGELTKLLHISYQKEVIRAAIFSSHS